MIRQSHAAKAADTANCRSVSPQQSSVLKLEATGTWNLISVSLFLKFVDHQWNIQKVLSPPLQECFLYHWKSLKELESSTLDLSRQIYLTGNWISSSINQTILGINRQFLKCPCISYLCVPFWRVLHLVHLFKSSWFTGKWVIISPFITVCNFNSDFRKYIQNIKIFDYQCMKSINRMTIFNQNKVQPDTCSFPSCSCTKLSTLVCNNSPISLSCSVGKGQSQL